MHRVACGVGGCVFLATSLAMGLAWADVGHASTDLGPLHLDLNAGVSVDQVGGPRAYQPWTALAATYAATPRIGIALEPHYLADASPVAARDWLVIDAAIDVVGWDQRSVTAIVGASVAPVRLWDDPAPRAGAGHR